MPLKISSTNGSGGNSLWEVNKDNPNFIKPKDDKGIDVNGKRIINVGTPTFLSDATTKVYVDNLLDKKQNKLIAGENIKIDKETNTISATGGGVDPNNYYTKPEVDKKLEDTKALFPVAFQLNAVSQEIPNLETTNKTVAGAINENKINIDKKQDKENWVVIGKSKSNREYGDFKLNFSSLYRVIITWEKPPFNEVNTIIKIEFKTSNHLGGKLNEKFFLTKGLINNEEAILYLQFLGNNKWQLIIEGGNQEDGNIFSLEELQDTIKIDITPKLKINSRSLETNEIEENIWDIELKDILPTPSIPQWKKVADVFCKDNKDWITYNCLPDTKYKIWYNISPTNCTPSSEHTFMSQEFVYSYNQKVPAIVVIASLDNKLLKLEKGNPDKFGWDNNSYGNLWKLEELQE